MSSINLIRNIIPILNRDNINTITEAVFSEFVYEEKII